MTQQMMSSMAPVHASPFAALADCNGAFMPAADADAAAALVQLCQQQPMAQQQRAATCGYPNACNGTPAAVRGSLPLHMDLDALLAAASCKPGYNSACMPVSCKPASVPASLQAAEAAAAHRASAVSAVLQQYGALQVASGSAAGIADAALGVIGGSGVCDTFYVYDLGEVARLHATWLDTMPRVAPFYAVKCNPEPGMVRCGCAAVCHVATLLACDRLASLQTSCMQQLFPERSPSAAHVSTSVAIDACLSVVWLSACADPLRCSAWC